MSDAVEELSKRFDAMNAMSSMQMMNSQIDLTSWMSFKGSSMHLKGCRRGSISKTADESSKRLSKRFDAVEELPSRSNTCRCSSVILTSNDSLWSLKLEGCNQIQGTTLGPTVLPTRCKAM